MVALPALTSALSGINYLQRGITARPRVEFFSRANYQYGGYYQ
jgi:hypothetical protein